MSTTLVHANFYANPGKAVVLRQWVGSTDPITVEQGVTVGFVFDEFGDAKHTMLVFYHAKFPVMLPLDKPGHPVVVGDFCYRRVAVRRVPDGGHKEIMIEVSRLYLHNPAPRAGFAPVLPFHKGGNPHGGA